MKLSLDRFLSRFRTEPICTQIRTALQAHTAQQLHSGCQIEWKLNELVESNSDQGVLIIGNNWGMTAAVEGRLCGRPPVWVEAFQSCESVDSTEFESFQSFESYKSFGNESFQMIHPMNPLAHWDPHCQVQSAEQAATLPPKLYRCRFSPSSSGERYSAGGRYSAGETFGLIPARHSESYTAIYLVNYPAIYRATRLDSTY